MRRDMDLVRNILLEIEDGKDWFETTSDATAVALGSSPTGLTQDDADRLSYHLNLLQAAGFAEFTSVGTGWIPEGLTWAGHDFLESVRDEEIWRKTKEGAEAAKGFTVELLAALAKGFIKKQIETRTGVSLEL
jgi:hypothetical protein